jgi:uncharacterized phage protein gp47/JayE
MLTIDQIVTQIVNQLRLLDPTVSAEIGTPERKIIEAVSELIASQQVDFTVLNQQHDISSMSGGRLDAYLSLFNFGRQQATPSYGIVTFTTNIASPNAITIPRGTPVIANIDSSTFPTLTFITTETVVLEAGSTSVDAPAQCTIGGTIGNIDANKIVGFGGLVGINGISGVSNAQAFSGGTDQEDDASYKTRFQNTFLRNISGTTDMFLALAVSVNAVTKANVVGPVSRYQEYIEIPGADDANQVTPYDPAGTIFPHKRTSAESTIPYSKHTYTENYYLTDGTLDPATAKFFKPGVDYIFNTPPWDGTAGAPDSANPFLPDITFLNPLAAVNVIGNPDLEEGDIVFLEHAYLSVNSRNDTSYGILNCVDIYVNGENQVSADSIEVVPSDANDVQNTNTLLWTYQKLSAPKVINWRRKIDGVPSDLGNRLQPLYWQPVLDVPDTLEVGSNTYYKANFFNTDDGIYYNSFDGTSYTFKAHYIVVEEVNSHYGTIRARNGIEWFLSGFNFVPGQLPTDDNDDYSGVTIDTLVGTEFSIEQYLYDGNISDLQAIMEKNKQVTTDVLVHKAKLRYFRPIITVMYSFGSTRAVVDASIIAALGSFYENQYYGAAIQLSDILQTIHNVPGVDNVRFTNDDPMTGHKLEEVAANGESLSGGPFYIVTDFFIQDNELAASPSDNAVTITVKAQNTWGF